MTEVLEPILKATQLHKPHEEGRQGEAYPAFTLDETIYQRHFYIESYGCAMNFADSEVVASILNNNGFGATRNVELADLILVNTCSIREKAEQTVRKRLTEFRKLKDARPGTLVGVLGCMAERLKSKFLEEEKLVDMVVGPDSYRTLPALIQEAGSGQKAVNVLLSRDETYGDISPIRLNSNGISAFVSIMRGCNNMCSFCVVPFTRGRERSRDAVSIVAECRNLFERGYKEVTLLGQNVDSYYYQTASPTPPKEGLRAAEEQLNIGQQEYQAFQLTHDTIIYNSEATQLGLSPSFGGVGEAAPITFARLLEMVALISPTLRVRFSTSHPKDITDDVLYTIAKYENICKYIHLPVQSGSSRVLQLMNRTYSREWYLAKIDRIRKIIPDCGITSDIIAGFCTETEEDHQATMSLMAYSGFDLSYMYFYSERPGTLAARRYKDDVPLETKKRRLQEIVDVQYRLSFESNLLDVGKTFTVLVEGDSKKSATDWMGRNSQNKVIIFSKGDGRIKKGDYVSVQVTGSTKATLLGKIVAKIELQKLM